MKPIQPLNILPILAIVEDYHDLAFISYSLVPECNYTELGTTYSGPNPYLMYVGILYWEDIPSKEEINELLKKHNVTLEKQ